MPRDSKGIPFKDENGSYVMSPLIINEYVYINWTNNVHNHSVKIIKLPSILVSILFDKVHIRTVHVM